MFFNGNIDLVTVGQVYNFSFKGIGVNADPFRFYAGSASFHNGFNLFGRRI